MTGQAWGKTIFFGEHFVVHGLPAIVSALDKYIEVKIELADKFEIVDNAPRFPSVPKITWEMGKKPIRAILDHLRINEKFKITLSGNLPIPNGGIGSSAASAVALARAINEMFQLNLSEQEISNTAFQGEKICHGNPSGIDNTAATFGGVFLFEQGKITPIQLKKPIDIILVESGKKTNAKKAIEALKELKENEPDFVEEIFGKYKKLIKKAHQAFIDYDLEQIGSLMNKNHELLKELTLSCDELEDVVKIARDAGALGAKLTGSGRGGLALALTPKNQNKVAVALEKSGYAALETTITQTQKTPTF
jgi:mevalonate kinase